MADSLFNFPTLQAGQEQMPYLQGVNPYDPMITGGFAGGPMAGTFFNDYQNAVGRNERASDLEYANAQNTFQNTLADNPLREAQRGLISQGQQVEKGLYDSGLRKQQATTSATADIATNIAKISSADLQTMNNHLDGMTQIQQEIAQNPNFLKDPDAQAAIKNTADKFNIDGLPEPGKWKQSDLDHVNRMAYAATQTVKQRQGQQVINQQYVNDVGVANAQAGQGRIPLQMIMQYHTQMAVAGLQANLALMKEPFDKQIQVGFINKLASGGTMTEGDIKQLEAAYTKEIKDQPTLLPAIASAMDSFKSYNEPQLKAAVKELTGQEPAATRTAQMNQIRSFIETKEIQKRIYQQVGPLLKNIPFNGDDGQQKHFKQDTNGNWLLGNTGAPNVKVEQGSNLGVFNQAAGVPGQNAGVSPINFGPSATPPFAGQSQSQPTAQPQGQSAPQPKPAVHPVIDPNDPRVDAYMKMNKISDRGQALARLQKLGIFTPPTPPASSGASGNF